MASQPQSTVTEVFTSVTTDIFTLTAGLYCTCAGDLIAGLYTSYATNNGAPTVYCATGTSGTPTGIATPSPSAGNPGSADNPAWASVACDYGSLNNIANNPQTQWDDAGGDAAWEAMITDFELNPQGLNLPNFVGNFFHAR